MLNFFSQIRCRTGYFFNENGDDETLANIKCSKGKSAALMTLKMLTNYLPHPLILELIFHAELLYSVMVTCVLAPSPKSCPNHKNHKKEDWICVKPKISLPGLKYAFPRT